MHSKILSLAGLSAGILLFLPFLLICVAPPDSGFIVMLMLFYVVNPLYSLWVGFVAGKALRQQWFQPILAAVLFILGTQIFLAPGEPIFFLYGLGYFVLGTCSMLISHYLREKKQH